MSILDRSKHMRDAYSATHHPLMCMMEEEIAQGGAETARMEAEKALVAELERAKEVVEMARVKEKMVVELERAKEVGKLEANSAAKSCARLS
jgi:predicted type IV restriction endonuclease